MKLYSLNIFMLKPPFMSYLFFTRCGKKHSLLSEWRA